MSWVAGRSLSVKVGVDDDGVGEYERRRPGAPVPECASWPGFPGRYLSSGEIRWRPDDEDGHVPSGALLWTKLDDDRQRKSERGHVDRLVAASEAAEAELERLVGEAERHEARVKAAQKSAELAVKNALETGTEKGAARRAQLRAAELADVSSGVTKRLKLAEAAVGPAQMAAEHAVQLFAEVWGSKGEKADVKAQKAEAKKRKAAAAKKAKAEAKAAEAPEAVGGP